MISNVVARRQTNVLLYIANSITTYIYIYVCVIFKMKSYQNCNQLVHIFIHTYFFL